MIALKLAYVANIVILLPIALPTALRRFDVAQGRFQPSEGWEILVGSLWTAILLCSVGGLFWPEPFVVVLLLQVIYKSMWLGLYAAPRVLSGRAREVPSGIAFSFLGIVAVWPFIIPWGRLLGG